MTLGEGGQHPHTGEEVSELPEDIVKVPSPWVKPKDRAADQDEAHEWWLDEAGNPWPDLVDNRGRKWSKEEADVLTQEGSVVYRDPELFGKDVPEPRIDTQPAKWKKD